MGQLLYRLDISQTDSKNMDVNSFTSTHFFHTKNKILFVSRFTHCIMKCSYPADFDGAPSVPTGKSSQTSG